MGGSAALLVVLTVIGYVLLRHSCHRTSFRWQALEWQQNLFESTATGLLFFGAGLGIAEFTSGPPAKMAQTLVAMWPLISWKIGCGAFTEGTNK